MSSASAVPSVELPCSNIANSNSSSVSVNAPITINASPGVSADEVAKQVSKELNERKNQAQGRQRAVNYD
jgi:hypothetical protein